MVGCAHDVTTGYSTHGYASSAYTGMMQRVSKWLAECGLSLASEKTEIVVLTALPIQVGENMVLSKTAVKYLGIMTDTKIVFFEQIHNSVHKAEPRMSAI